MGRRQRPMPPLLADVASGVVRSAISLLGIGDVRDNVRRARSVARWYAPRAWNRARLARAESHLRLAFPEWSADQHRRYALLAYEHLFELAVEFAFAPRLIGPDGWGHHIRAGRLAAALRALACDHRPCIMITGHCGNWELLGFVLTLLGFRIAPIYRPLDLAPLDVWVRTTRSRHGMLLVDKFGAAERLPRLMAEGFSPGFVADQNAGDRGLFVPYFGRLASTYKSIGLLAVAMEATVLCGWAKRMPRPASVRFEAPGDEPPPSDPVLGLGGVWPDGMGYELELVDSFGPEDWNGQPDPLYYIAARYRRAIETMVRAGPDQYLWMHRYWKSRPRHERLGRPMPDALRRKIAELPWMTPDEVGALAERSERDGRESLAVTPPPADAA